MGIDLIVLVITTALSSLASSGKISGAISQTVSSLAPIISSTIHAFQSGQGKTEDAITALGSLSGVLAVLKAQKDIPENVANEINVYDTAIQQAMAGYLASKSGVDLSKLTSVEPIA